MRPDSEAPERPPAGGFGAGPAGEPAFRAHARPPRPNHGGVVLAVAATVFVAALVAFVAWGEWRKAKAARHAEAIFFTLSVADEAKRGFDATGKLCPSAAPVPARFASISGMKYQSAGSDWTDDPGWSCLHFQIKEPQRFQYHYERTADGFVMTAEGDLNGKGLHSLYRIGGHIEAGKLIVDPTLAETNPDE